MGLEYRLIVLYNRVIMFWLMLRRYLVALLLILSTVIGFWKLNYISPAHYELASRSISLENRYTDRFVNNIFRDNILLTLAYSSGIVKNPHQINWSDIEKPFVFDIFLNPGEVFAFHDNVYAIYDDKVLKTTGVHFSASEGFLSDGYLYGNGVCHLASLMNWAAIDAGLKVIAPTNHDFAVIPEVPSEYGVSIYASADKNENSKRQNLYIENNFNYPVIFAFRYNNGVLDLKVLRKNS